MKIYIAGPMRGVEDYRERFAAAAQVLESHGHTVLNPAVLPAGLGGWNTYMKLCYQMIDLCDAVAMLPGWEKSTGACLERGYAIGIDKLVVEYEEPGAEDPGMKQYMVLRERCDSAAGMAAVLAEIFLDEKEAGCYCAACRPGEACGKACSPARERQCLEKWLEERIDGT